MSVFVQHYKKTSSIWAQQVKINWLTLPQKYTIRVWLKKAKCHSVSLNEVNRVCVCVYMYMWYVYVYVKYVKEKMMADCTIKNST